ncbi:MAG: hypothetical protein WEC34_07460 [Acidimicrobiia bacterium]
MTAAISSTRRHPFRPRFAVRSTELGPRCDTFLAVAVTSVLANRLFLVITGYPQLGNGTLHISHAIWGALMMGTALILAISFLAPSTRWIVAILGGAGFGWFIDELGKFITREVNYFYQPTIALIYMTFIALYLVIRSLQRRAYTPEEGVLNGLEALKAAALGRLPEPERREALALLTATNANSGFAGEVRALLEKAPSLEPREPSLVVHWAESLRDRYLDLAQHPRFIALIDVLFTFFAVTALLTVLSLALDGPGVVTFTERAGLLSSMVANACLIIGVVVLLRTHDRLRAYRWFDRGLLITIFVTQVFVFAEEQLGGTVGLLLTLMVWGLLRGAMSAERGREA